jgi:stearoyl-CoA desaturase (delta-9 desaturase)
MSDNKKLLVFHSIGWFLFFISLVFLPLFTLIYCLIIGYLLAVFGHIIGLHRYFTHKSFDTNKFWHYFLLFCSSIVTLGSTVAWTAVHLKHHRFSDTEQDSHSPKYKGHFKVFFGYFFDAYDVEPRYAARLLKYPEHKFVHKHYFKLLSFYIVLLAAINPILIFPLWVFPTVLSVVMGGIVNVFNHWNGEVSDSKLIAWTVAGEGWHKYHHINSTAWRNPSPDLSGFFIRLIKSNQ